MIITVTVDTNCINLKKHPSLDIIYNLYYNSKIKIYKTDTLDTELIFSNPKKSDIKENRLNKSNSLKEDLGIGFWGQSRWNHCKWGNKKESFVEEFKNILFRDYERMSEKKRRNAFRDCMHLSTHLINKRDYFITLDKHFRSNNKILKDKYNLKIIHPDDFIKLEKIQKILDKNKI